MRCLHPILAVLLSTCVSFEVLADPGSSPGSAVDPADAAPAPAPSGVTVRVPEAWREPARRLMDPGAQGLPGGLVLERVELGDRVTAHYAGPAGRLVASAMPPAAAGPDAAWRGQRIALVVGESTVAEPARSAAVDALIALLKQRESAWGWLKQAPEQGASGQQARQRALELVERAERLTALGDAEGAASAIGELRHALPTDLPMLLRVSRLARRAGLTGEPLAALTDAAVQVAGRAQGSLEGAGEDLDRLRLALASAMALAGRADEARRVTGPILVAGRVTCDATRVAEDLALAGSLAEARTLAEQVTRAAPFCDAAHAARVRFAQAAGDLDAAERAGAEALVAKPDAALTRSALARVALARGNRPEAVTLARVGVRERPHDATTLAAAAALVGAEAIDAVTADGWKGAMRRHVGQAPLQLLGVLACLTLEEPACALDAIRQARAAQGDHPLLPALEALALVRADRLPEARQALVIAWSQVPFEATTLAAEAEVAMAEGDATRARRAWTAYQSLAQREGGPVSLETVAALLNPKAPTAVAEAPTKGEPKNAHVGRETPAEAPSAAATQDAQDRRWLVLGVGMMVMLALALVLAWRRRRG